MSYQNNPFVNDSTPNNQEITIDCENFNNNEGGVQVSNSSSNLTANHRRNQSGTSASGLANSSSAPTLFESTADNSSIRVVRSYREYSAKFINSDESDSNSDVTGPAVTATNDAISIDDKNTFDTYDTKSKATYDSDYFIKKSKTVKSTSTSSSRTAYRNPTLSSVVNQTLINSSFEKNYYDSQYDDIKKIKEENRKKKDPQLKLQKMILKVPETYDIPTRNKKIISQRILNLTLVLMLIIATTFLALYIYLKYNHGYSFPHLKDINDGNRTKIIFISLFMYLAVLIGSLGSALNWKSILVTYCIFCSLNALALGYLVYGIYDDAYKYTQLPNAWWDTYSSTTRRTIQDHFQCCGFKNSLDGGEISSFCPKQAVVWSIPYETIYDEFKLMKKDACAQSMNVIVVGKKDDVVLPTPVLDQLPTPSVSETAPAAPAATSSVAGAASTTTQAKATTTANAPSKTIISKAATTTGVASASAPSKSLPTTTRIASTNAETKPTPTTTTQEEKEEDNEEETTEKSKRSIEIEDEDMKIVKSSYYTNNIYKILAPNEVEEENDGRDDRDITSIRVLNKRTFAQETKDEQQARTNSTNPNINYEKIRKSNYTGMTPEQSREFASQMNLEGCEQKLQPYIHKNLVIIFYVLLVFFCLYIITIPTSLLFLFKLRSIPSINEFD